MMSPKGGSVTQMGMMNCNGCSVNVSAAEQSNSIRPRMGTRRRDYLPLKDGTDQQLGALTKKPAIPPTGTQSEIAFGTLIAGSATSSAIALIIPIAEKV